MQAWIIDFMEQFGYLGIFLLMCIENVFPPIPSEIILPFGGFMATRSDLNVLGVLFAATAGSLLGSVILFRIGLLLDVERMLAIVDKWGKYLRIKKEDIVTADAWFDKHGYWTVLFCRMLPLIRSLISIPAGMSNMKLSMFLFFTIVGTLIWNSVLVATGALLGNSWNKVLYYLEIYSTIIYSVMAMLGTVLIILFIRKNKK